MEQQMSSLLRKPIKAHQGTIVDGKIVYEGEDTSSGNIVPTESAPVATPATSITPSAVSTPALTPAPTPTPPPAPTTQQPAPQPVQQPAPQLAPSPPPQPVAQPVETPEQAEQVASTFVPENVKRLSSPPLQLLDAKPHTDVRPFQLIDGKVRPSNEQLLELIKKNPNLLETKKNVLDQRAAEYTKQNPQALQQQSLLPQQVSDALRKQAEQILQKHFARQQTPKRLPQPYRPTQEERFELDNLNNIVRSSPEYKLLQKESKEFVEIQQKELGPYHRKVSEAVRQFGPQSQEFKNAMESMQFQQRLFAKQYAPTMQRLNKLQLDFNLSDAFKNFREAQGRIFNRKQINPSVPSQFNKGGMSMEQQMSLFEEGGMKDDGLDRDPVSGNDIPPGSLAKEVRDDIPAQLSDGEYVVPADVVQYYGVKFFEDLRAEAKRGLAEMEATGRIGGEPVSMTMIAIGQAEEEKKKKAQGGVIKANEGVLAETEQVKQSGSFDYKDWAVPGFTPGSPVYQVKPNSTDQDIRIITYYHPTKGSKDVKFINGVVNPPEDIKFTQPPWSINKPTPSQQRNRERQTGSSNVQQKMNLDSWGLDPKVYNFSTWNRERFLKEAESQLKLSASERFITGFATLVNPFLGLAIRGLATGDGFAKTKVLIKMANAAGDEETANALQTMYDKAKESVGGVQGWLLNTDTADKGISGAATLIVGQMSKTNPTFVNFVGNNSLNQESNFKEAKYEKPIGPNLPPMQGPMQPSSNTKSGTVLATSDTENVGNFGGRDVDVDATLSNFGLGNNNITKETLPAPEEPTIATDFATDDKDPVSAEEENLSEAYGGGEASKKFGMKKGGLATKTKTKTRKPRTKGLGNKK